MKFVMTPEGQRRYARIQEIDREMKATRRKLHALADEKRVAIKGWANEALIEMEPSDEVPA